jgi:hypothetical protein
MQDVFKVENIAPAPRLNSFWLIDWLFTVLRPAQEFLTYMETSE